MAKKKKAGRPKGSISKATKVKRAAAVETKLLRMKVASDGFRLPHGYQVVIRKRK